MNQPLVIGCLLPFMLDRGIISFSGLLFFGWLGKLFFVWGFCFLGVGW
jgi:hypothetical protein